MTRLANIYGPGDFNLSPLVPDTARALVRGERPVIRSDGTPQRDFIHVADAVEAYLAVADSLARLELHGRAWNAGAGPVIEVVERLIAASGRDWHRTCWIGLSRGEIDRQWLDSTAIRRELGCSRRASSARAFGRPTRGTRRLSAIELGGFALVIWWRLRSTRLPAAAETRSRIPCRGTLGTGSAA